MRRPLALVLAMLALGVFAMFACPTVLSWSNGPAGNATTNQASQCAAPSYATHDWIADHALADVLHTFFLNVVDED